MNIDGRRPADSRFRVIAVVSSEALLLAGALAYVALGAIAEGPPPVVAVLR